MPVTTINGREIHVDDEGFLTEYDEWDENLAKVLATNIGIDLTDVFLALENEGVEKFEKSWQELLDATQGQLDDKK